MLSRACSFERALSRACSFERASLALTALDVVCELSRASARNVHVGRPANHSPCQTGGAFLIDSFILMPIEASGLQLHTASSHDGWDGLSDAYQAACQSWLAMDYSPSASATRAPIRKQLVLTMSTPAPGRSTGVVAGDRCA